MTTLHEPVPGYRQDLLTYGPLTTDDYFVLAAIWLTPTGGANSLYSTTVIAMLGQTVPDLLQIYNPGRSCQSNISSIPELAFSPVLTSQLITGKIAELSVVPLYARYLQYKVTTNVNNQITVQMAIELFNYTSLASVGYLGTDLTSISSTPNTLTFYAAGVPSTSLFYAGLPLISPTVDVSWVLCAPPGNNNYGLCSGFTPCGRLNSIGGVCLNNNSPDPVIPYIVAFPKTAHPAKSCITALTANDMEIPRALAVQQCLTSWAPNHPSEYSLSTFCQDQQEVYFTTRETCEAYNSDVPVASGAIDGNVTCGNGSTFPIFTYAPNGAPTTSSATGTGPCPSGSACVYDNGVFSCLSQENNRSVPWPLVVGILLIIVIVVIVLVVIIVATSHHKPTAR